MTDDAFDAAAGRVADAGRQVCDAVETALRRLEAARGQRKAGTPLPDVVDQLIASGGRDARLNAAAAFLAYEQSVASMRAIVAQILIDEYDLSMNEVATKLRVSRQAVQRLLNKPM